MSGSQRRTQTAPAVGGLRRQGSSALPSPSRSASLTTEEASFAAAQELASVLNAPSSNSSWLGGWPFSAAGEDVDARPPPLPPGTLPEVTLQDFSRYLRTIGDRLEAFERSREAAQRCTQQALSSPEELRASQGQGLVAAMRDVPAPFFLEAFDLDQQQLWEELVQVHSEEARQESLERLTGYLDTVEAHLVREIAARTDNFFDASGYIQDVRGCVARVYQQVAALRQQMHELEQEMAAAVQTSQHLQRQRANLMSTLDILRAVDGVAQAQSALQGLLPCSGGVAVDYAGAIDVLEVLQGVLDDEALLGLECFKHLPEQIVETAQAVDDLMTTDFLERTRFTVQAAVVRGICDRLRVQLAASPISTPQRRHSSSLAPSRQLSAEESAELETLAAVKATDGKAVDRLVGWLERAAKDGAGNRNAFAEAGVADMDEEEADGEQELLLPLVIGLQRMGRLPVVMRGLKEVSVAGLKGLLSQVIEGCLDVLDPEAVPGDSSHLLASHRSTSPNGGPLSTAERLQQLPGQDFQWVLEAVVIAFKAYMNHCTAVGQAVQFILTAAKAPQQQLTSVAHEIKDCHHAVAEAAAARWSKVLNGRARGRMDVTGSGSRLSDLQGVLQLTDMLASLVEQHGVRSVLGLRSALQQLFKASLDAMHAKTLSKLTTLLEQEQWVAVQVPRQFQDIVDQLIEGGAAGADTTVPTASTALLGLGSYDGTAAADGDVRSNGTASRISSNSTNGGSLHGSSSHGAGQNNGGSGNALPAPLDAAVPRKFTITPHDDTSAGAAPVLVVGGQRYHVVNTQLLVLSMLRDYLAFRDAVPAFSAEVAQRVLELLKVFNSRTCQLVLGAGAMQVSGLKSITAKHLAISCQCLGAFIALHPTLVALFTQGVAPPRLAMLTADFGRALQDYAIHHEEVCSKLVSIMRERLSLNIKQLPAQAAAWPTGAERPELPAPSAFAATTAKQLQILSSVLTPLLLPAEVHSIFGRIGLMFSHTLAEAYELLEPHGAAWEQQLRADIQFLLNCLRNLPMDPAERDNNLERLTQLFERRFLLPSQPSRPADVQQAIRQPSQELDLVARADLATEATAAAEGAAAEAAVDMLPPAAQRASAEDSGQAAVELLFPALAAGTSLQGGSEQEERKSAHGSVSTQDGLQGMQEPHAVPGAAEHLQQVEPAARLQQEVQQTGGQEPLQDEEHQSEKIQEVVGQHQEQQERKLATDDPLSSPPAAHGEPKPP